MKRSLNSTLSVSAIFGLVLLGMAKMVLAAEPEAVAVIESKSGSSVTGEVKFIGERGGVRVKLQLFGLTPGAHGFHVHQNGDCSAQDASSAGPHFNPTGSVHGGPMTHSRHLGDLGNVMADEKGYVSSEVFDPALTLSGPNSVIGRGVVVHEKADDLVTDPAGGAGARIGCGVIKLN